MEKPVQNCIVCKQDHTAGIVIYDQFICYTCEQEMVKTDVRDERYQFFIQQMKQIWLKKDA